MMIREQFVVPEFHSKFVSRETLLAMYHGTIFSIKTNQLIVRNCARPPSKLVLATKMEKYLNALGKKSGINFAKANFPDKKYLVQIVAHLSKGNDEIFDSEFVPQSSIAKEVEKQLGKHHQPVLFAGTIPAHLLAKGSGRSLKLHQMTKAEKIEVQLQAAEARIAKQNAAKEKLKKQLQVIGSQDDKEIAKMVEREKIK